MENHYKACLVGCGRMGGTIDDEMRGHPYHVLPHTHAGACRAVDRIDLVAAADVVEENMRALCERYQIPRGSGYEFEVSGSEGRLRTINDTGALSFRKFMGEHKLLMEMPAVVYKRESGTINAMRDIVKALDTDGDTLGNLTLACRSQHLCFHRNSYLTMKTKDDYRIC